MCFTDNLIFDMLRMTTASATPTAHSSWCVRGHVVSLAVLHACMHVRATEPQVAHGEKGLLRHKLPGNLGRMGDTVRVSKIIPASLNPEWNESVSGHISLV